MSEHLPSGAAGVADEVRAAMARKRLSQAVVAHRAGMSTSTLSRRLQDGSGFTVDEVYRLAAVLEVSPGQLMPAGVA